MVVKWSHVDQNFDLNDSNLIDNYIKMSQNFNQSKMHFLNGYLYESPTHKGVMCWRALDELHKLENIKHLLAAVDYESDFKPFKYQNFSHSSPFKIDVQSFQNQPKSYYKPIREYVSPKPQKSHHTSIYEGCYNAHDLLTSLQIQKNLVNIYQTLTSKNHEKKFSPTKSIHENRLLDEYEKLKSNIENSSQIYRASKATSLKTDSIATNSSESVQNLERKSLNKISDELKSDCDDDNNLIYDDQSSICSSSPRISFKKNSISQIKKNIPPKRNRKRVMTNLDSELSSSDFEIENKFKKNARKSAFKPVENAKFQHTITTSEKKINNEKTEEELISEFEKVSPIDFNKLNKDDKTKIDQLCNDLFNVKSSNNNSSSAKSNFDSLKVTQKESIKVTEKDSNVTEKVEKDTTKTVIQRAASPVKVKEHLIEVYPVAGQKKPFPQQPKDSLIDQKTQVNKGEPRQDFNANSNNIGNKNNSKTRRNSSVKKAFTRIRQKLKIG